MGKPARRREYLRRLSREAPVRRSALYWSQLCWAMARIAQAEAFGIAGVKPAPPRPATRVKMQSWSSDVAVLRLGCAFTGNLAAAPTTAVRAVVVAQAGQERR